MLQDSGLQNVVSQINIIGILGTYKCKFWGPNLF